MDIAIMIEGQNGVYWDDWRRIVRAVEDLGFAGLYRSDHFPHGTAPENQALELWVSLTWLAAHTERIVFGSLVTPASFRPPVITAWMAYQVNDLSGGRLRLGLGAGWHQGEHEAYGFPLLSVAERFKRFEEYLQVVTRLLRSDRPVSFKGDYYTLRDAMFIPRPAPMPLTIGGNGRRRTLPLVAKYADEWNCVSRTPAQIVDLNAHLNDLLAVAGREPEDVRRTMMTGVFFGQDDAALKARIAQTGRSAEELRAGGALVGTPGALRDQLGELADLGLDGVMLQWLQHRDLAGLEKLAQAVL